MLQRVQKILAQAGIASRRKCEEFIQESRVKVNGKVIHLGDQADAERDKITLDNKPLPQSEKKVYFMINKPEDYVTTVTEPFGMKKVMDLIKVRERIFPVGRLDKNTSGLLLLTNDGELAQRLTHPSFDINKTYLIKIKPDFREADEEKIQEGIEIEGREVQVKRLELITPDVLLIEIHEGRKHIVRNLFEKLGYKVIKLTRTAFGPLKLQNLKPKQYRTLSFQEIQGLKKAVGLGK